MWHLLYFRQPEGSIITLLTSEVRKKHFYRSHSSSRHCSSVFVLLTLVCIGEWAIANDAPAQLCHLSESNHYLCLRSLPWESYIANFFKESTSKVLLRTVSELRKTASKGFLLTPPPVIGDPPREDLIVSIPLLYTQREE